MLFVVKNTKNKFCLEKNLGNKGQICFLHFVFILQLQESKHYKKHEVSKRLLVGPKPGPKPHAKNH